MIQQKVDDRLLIEDAKKAGRVRSGKWNASSLGKCYRSQYWNRKGEPKSNPISIDALRRFKIGNLIHQYFEDILKEDHFIEVKVEDDNSIGYADIVGIDEVVDIKSVRSFQYKLMKDKKKPYDFKKEKKDNILQVTYYAKGLGKAKGRLIFVDKDSLDAIEFEFDVAGFERDLQEELEVLNGYWAKEKLPPPMPRLYNGKECAYCGFSLLDSAKSTKSKEVYKCKEK